MTTTIELPEDLAARLATVLPPGEVQAFAVAATASALAQLEEEREEERRELARETAGLGELRPYGEYPDRAAYLADARARAEEHGGDPDLVEALADGLADATEGKLFTWDEVEADAEALLAARRQSRRSAVAT